MNIPEGNPGVSISQNYQLIFFINHQASSPPSVSEESGSKTGSKSVPDWPTGLLKHYSLLWITHLAPRTSHLSSEMSNTSIQHYLPGLLLPIKHYQPSTELN